MAVINAIGEISKQEAVDALERELWRPNVSVQHAEVSEMRADEVPEHEHMSEREVPAEAEAKTQVNRHVWPGYVKGDDEE